MTPCLLKLRVEDGIPFVQVAPSGEFLEVKHGPIFDVRARPASRAEEERDQGAPVFELPRGFGAMRRLIDRAMFEKVYTLRPVTSPSGAELVEDLRLVVTGDAVAYNFRGVEYTASLEIVGSIMPAAGSRNVLIPTCRIASMIEEGAPLPEPRPEQPGVRYGGPGSPAYVKPVHAGVGATDWTRTVK